MNLFQLIAKRGQIPRMLIKDVKDARDWWRQRASEMNARPDKMVKQKGFLQQTIHGVEGTNIGEMLFFSYSAKWAKKLPYWDKYPLIFVVDMAPNGFYGINLHYLPPILRAQLMNALYTRAYTAKDGREKIKISYDILKGATKFRLFKPCFKHYLAGHVQSGLYRVEPNDWDKALMLPLARFQKEKQQEVWRKSMEKVR